MPGSRPSGSASSDELVAPRPRDLERDLGVVERPVFGVAQAGREFHRGHGRVVFGTYGHLHLVGHVADEPADRLAPRLDRGRSAATFSRCMPQRHRSPIKSAAAWPLPNCWTTRAGAVAPDRVGHLGQHDGPRLDVADPAQRVERDHRGQPLSVLVLGFPQPDPRLEPAFAGELQAILGVVSVRGAGAGPVQIHRQELADRSAVVLALGERIGTAEHRAGRRRGRSRSCARARAGPG